VALIDDGRLRGYNLLAGAASGDAQQSEDIPALGSPIAFVEPHRIFPVVDAVIGIQRDCGNRLDRKQARLKYLIAAQGPEWLHEEMEKRLGYSLAPPEAIPDSEWHVDDHLGWHPQSQPDLSYGGVYVPMGRVVDGPAGPFRSTLRGIVEDYRPELRITPGQSLVLAHVSSKYRSEIEARLNDAGLAMSPGKNLSVLMRNATSCVALPTCPLALAESERVLPALIRRLEELGYAGDAVSIRVSGCPNSCSRAPTAEIGLLGRAPGKYNLYVGGSPLGTRLNRLIQENVVFDELPARIAALLQAWRQERLPEEPFGDWADRTGFGSQPVAVAAASAPAVSEMPSAT